MQGQEKSRGNGPIVATTFVFEPKSFIHAVNVA